MSLFFPDNDKRTTRVIQLGSDAQQYLYQAQQDYGTFKKLLDTVNSKIKNAYKEAALQPPTITSVDIVEAGQVAGASASVDVAKVIADIGGFFGTVKFLVPGVTKALTASGQMGERMAAKVLAEFTIPLIDKQVSITLADVAGAVIGGVVGGVAIAGLDLAIDAIEGSIARDKLRQAILEVHPLRSGTKLSQEKAATLLEGLRAIDTTLDAISGAGLDLTEQAIINLINKDVNPSIKKVNAITADTIAADLQKMDADSKAWTDEDPK